MILLKKKIKIRYDFVDSYSLLSFTRRPTQFQFNVGSMVVSLCWCNYPRTFIAVNSELFLFFIIITNRTRRLNQNENKWFKIDFSGFRKLF